MFYGTRQRLSKRKYELPECSHAKQSCRRKILNENSAVHQRYVVIKVDTLIITPQTCFANGMAVGNDITNSVYSLTIP